MKTDRENMRSEYDLPVKLIMKANREQTGVVFNIQKFSVNDGPGIRIVVFFKGCPLSCQWCSNPESQSTKVQILWDTKKCVHCLHCIDTCQKDAIKEENNEIHIDHKACIGCLKCEQECPQHALKHEGDTKTVQQVMDVVKQDEVFYEESGDVIPSGAYVSPNGNTVSSVNELHAEAKNLIRQKHGVSTRHLQGYLDWIVFKKKLKYTLDMRKWKPEAYMESMLEQIPFICRDIVKLPMPIDLYRAYGEYHYGIFANIN